jgi:hypothetical protein
MVQAAVPAEAARQAEMNIWISNEDMQRLNQLMGLALLEPAVSDLFLRYRDERLMTEFGITFAVREWLKQVRATTLVELAQAIVKQREKNAFVIGIPSSTPN